jgi:hypothetical protein
MFDFSSATSTRIHGTAGSLSFVCVLGCVNRVIQFFAKRSLKFIKQNHNGSSVLTHVHKWLNHFRAILLLIGQDWPVIAF